MARTVDLKLDKARRLRFDVNALDELERLLGVPLGETLGLLARLSVRALRVAIWQGLRHEDRNLTAARAGELIQDYLERGGQVGDLNDAVIDAIYASGILKRPEEAAASDPPAATT